MLNADFSRSALVTPDQYQWVPSPQEGVERVMLDRLGSENARATSIVRYAPQSHFPSHTHPGGEEVLVLSGTFSEDGEHYAAGWYLRNPPGSGHQPSSKEGALIFVKVRQIPAAEERPVRLDTRNPSSWRRHAGREVCPLFSSDAEQVCLQRLSPGEVLFGDQAGGTELLVLAGDLIVGARSCVRGSWLRLPPKDNPGLTAGTQGRHHLPEDRAFGGHAGESLGMHRERVAIVGAGLSGLYAAWLLEKAGVKDYVLLEARSAPGGRIVSVSAAARSAGETASPLDDIDRFDLGPTWFWPELQPQLDGLVRELGLERFAQHEAGDMVVERSVQEPPTRMRGYVNSPVSTRLVGGMSALVDALHRRLDPTALVVGQAVRRLRSTASGVEVESEDAARRISTWRAEHVLLALPPRLAAETIEFTPALPSVLAQQWRSTATWMAPHAKYLAIYDTPFWREQGLSGEGRSARGPLGEIHDASMPGASAALFGFFGVPTRVRNGLTEAVLKLHARAQLVRLFGPLAATPKTDAIKDWALDPYTAAAADLDGADAHGEAPAAAPSSGPWAGRLVGIASEWSRQFPGYVAGAIEPASFGVQELLTRSDSAHA